jgi:phosphoribosylaminoimidazolecarboxamide formyltransferase/IMP cyclohydrolase
MDGRLNTLHPKVHGGILGRHDRPDDLAALAEHAIQPLPLIVVNLYPFEATVARADVTFDEAIENIDIGGPTMIRAAAKNHAFTTICTDPSQYDEVLAEIRRHGATTLALRKRLATAAFALTARYDCAIADYLERLEDPGPLPRTLRLTLPRRELLRYGENPHQQGALYAHPAAPSGTLPGAKQLHGKELSYNNLLDLDAALAIVRLLPGPAAAVVIKHNNPCGAASAGTLRAATENALAGDPQSAFGSVLGLSSPVDGATAELLCTPGLFVEAIAAPAFEPEAVTLLTTKPKWKDNVRLLAVGEWQATAAARLETRHIAGGLLAQEPDSLPDDEAAWRVVTTRQPSDVQWADLRFGWAVVRGVKSNAIVLAQGQTLWGVGAGQMSRVDSVEIAIRKAGEHARGAALASDAFFPFADSIDQAAAAGVAAIIQPGGSRRDDEVIAACNEHGVPMIFTGRRHFKH